MNQAPDLFVISQILLISPLLKITLSVSTEKNLHFEQFIDVKTSFYIIVHSKSQTVNRGRDTMEKKNSCD